MNQDGGTADENIHILPPPKGLTNWVAVFGPGAIIASLTIGTGELVFSSRAGALFGYPIISLFVGISILKWALVLGSARHMVLTGVHPFERMAEFPGPRGWVPRALLILAATAIPIWVAFHCGVVGNLLSWASGTRGGLDGGVDFVWGAAVLAVVFAVSLRAGTACSNASKSSLSRRYSAQRWSLSSSTGPTGSRSSVASLFLRFISTPTGWHRLTQISQRVRSGRKRRSTSA